MCKTSRYHRCIDEKRMKTMMKLIDVYMWTLSSETSAHWAKIGGHVDIEMCHFDSF